MLFKSRRNEYADTDGPVRYLDDSGLRRPLDMPRPQIAIMFAFVLVAALIGGYFFIIIYKHYYIVFFIYIFIYIFFKL